MTRQFKIGILVLIIVLFVISGNYMHNVKKMDRELKIISNQTIEEYKNKDARNMVPLTKLRNDILINLEDNKSGITMIVSNNKSKVITDLDYEWEIQNQNIENSGIVITMLNALFTLVCIISVLTLLYVLTLSVRCSFD